jgi:superfamily II DNA/RNA helicase
MDFTRALSLTQHQQVLKAFLRLDLLSQGSQCLKLFQLRCLISLLSVRHVVLQAVTGSGKTLAMILPLLNHMWFMNH